MAEKDEGNKHVKVYGYTFRVSNSVIYIFASLLSFTYLPPLGFTIKEKNLLLLFTLKEKNLLQEEQILFFNSKPQFGRALSSVRETNWKS